MKKMPRLTVGAMIFNHSGDLLLLKSPKWDGRFIFPCGHVEFGESLEDAVKREVFEETGLNVYDLRFLTHLEFIESGEFHKKDLHFVGLQFTCKTKDSNVMLNEEATEYIWKSPEESLNLNLEKGTTQAIETLLRK